MAEFIASKVPEGYEAKQSQEIASSSAFGGLLAMTVLKLRYKDRVKTLKKRLRREKLGSLLIAKKENVNYLCGFDAEEATLVVTSVNEDFIITDSRFKQKAEEELTDFSLKLIDGSRYSIISNIIKGHKIKRLGFESDWLSYKEYSSLKKKLKRTELIPKRNLVENLRIIKDAEEISLIKNSIAIVKKAYLYAKKNISPRLNGQKLATLIDNFMKAQGASRPAFQTIVAQNPYSSYPHGPATEGRFGRDSAVLIDMGAVFRGYNSDLTRVIFLGRISTKFKRIYNILKTAQKKAYDIIKPGVAISELDRVVRQHLINKGVGKYFLHSLGHGIGLEIHESPKVSRRNKRPLRPGMVFTVEPGVYIPGWGGLRLEDMVLVTKNGLEILTNDIPK